MATSKKKNAEAIKKEILKMATTDSTFRALLLNNPKKAIRDTFTEVPEILPDINIHVHVDSEFHIHLVLDEEELLDKIGW